MGLFLIAIKIYAPIFGNLYHKLIFNPLWDILIDVGYIGMGYGVHWDILVSDILLWDSFVWATLSFSCHPNLGITKKCLIGSSKL